MPVCWLLSLILNFWNLTILVPGMLSLTPSYFLYYMRLRFLRTLVSLGVLSQPQPHTYALTAIGEALRSDIPGSMRDLLIAETDAPHWQAWGKLYIPKPQGGVHQRGMRFLVAIPA